VKQNPTPRTRLFIRELVPDWHPTWEQGLWTVRITILVVVVLGVLTLISWPFGISLWEWVKILIVPVVIAAGGIWFNRQQQQRELEVEKQRTQDEALQAYLDQIGKLLLDKDEPLRQSGDNVVRMLARARTLTVLRRLAPGRKRSILDFLYEADLIKADLGDEESPPVIELGSPDSHYGAADLSRADLKGAFLRDADLSGRLGGHIGANLSGADLRGADLRGAIMTRATLRGADLRGAYLIGTEFTWANLQCAKLSGAYFEVSSEDITQLIAEIKAAGLPDETIEQDMGARLKLMDANLEWADLSEVRGITNEELEQQAASLEGATMPNGQKYEDWLKDREGREEVGETD
jgi:uncharacterized protein YjbI with pentapeptide repeats